VSPSAALRAGDYKLVERFSDGSVELFNLKEDEGEHHDLSETMPEMTETLKAMLHQWREDTDAYMPTDKIKK
jgi:arylsulfatase A